MGFPGADDLVAAADRCFEVLEPVAGADWSVTAAGTEWSCRQTLEHLCGLDYSAQLATRASGFTPLVLQVGSTCHRYAASRTRHRSPTLGALRISAGRDCRE